MALSDEIERGLDALGLLPTGPEVSRLARYIEMLHRWNKTYNLTAVRDPTRMVTYHLLDSLSVLAHCQGDQLMDLGSGAGLPGIPIAILRPDWQICLVDSNGKKTRFLRHVVQQLGLPGVTVERSRGEDVNRRFNTITVRAFGSLHHIAEMAEPRLANGGRVVVMKAHIPDDEWRDFHEGNTGLEVSEQVELQVPGVAGVRSVVLLSRSDQQ